MAHFHDPNGLLLADTESHATFLLLLRVVEWKIQRFAMPVVDYT